MSKSPTVKASSYIESLPQNWKKTAVQGSIITFLALGIITTLGGALLLSQSKHLIDLPFISLDTMTSSIILGGGGLVGGVSLLGIYLLYRKKVVGDLPGEQKKESNQGSGEKEADKNSKLTTSSIQIQDDPRLPTPNKEDSPKTMAPTPKEKESPASEVQTENLISTSKTDNLSIKKDKTLIPNSSSLIGTQVPSKDSGVVKAKKPLIYEDVSRSAHFFLFQVYQHFNKLLLQSKTELLDSECLQEAISTFETLISTRQKLVIANKGRKLSDSLDYACEGLSLERKILNHKRAARAFRILMLSDVDFLAVKLKDLKEFDSIDKKDPDIVILYAIIQRGIYLKQEYSTKLEADDDIASLFVSKFKSDSMDNIPSFAWVWLEQKQIIKLNASSHAKEIAEKLYAFDELKSVKVWNELRFMDLTDDQLSIVFCYLSMPNLGLLDMNQVINCPSLNWDEFPVKNLDAFFSPDYNKEWTPRYSRLKSFNLEYLNPNLKYLSGGTIRALLKLHPKSDKLKIQNLEIAKLESIFNFPTHTSSSRKENEEIEKEIQAILETIHEDTVALLLPKLKGKIFPYLTAAHFAKIKVDSLIAMETEEPGIFNKMFDRVTSNYYSSSKEFFLSIGITKINALASYLRGGILRLLPEEMLKSLKLDSSILEKDPEKLNIIFRYRFPGEKLDLAHYEALKKKMAPISSPVVNEWLPFLDEQLLSLLSPKQLAEIDASKLLAVNGIENRLKALFKNLSDLENKNTKLIEDYFQALGIKNVNTLLLVLPDDVMHRIPKSLLSELSLEKLDAFKIDHTFSYHTDIEPQSPLIPMYQLFFTTAQSRISQISTTKINLLLQQEKLSAKTLAILSADQMKKLDKDALKKQKMVISDLKKILDRINYKLQKGYLTKAEEALGIKF